MPPPKVLGPSQRVPGLYDVETERGVFPMPRETLVLHGLGAQLREGDAAVQQMQPAPAPQLANLGADIATAARGDLAPPPPRAAPAPAASDAPSATDRVVGGAVGLAQDAAEGIVDAAGLRNVQTRMLAQAGASTDARAQQMAEAQRRAAADADRAIAAQAQTQTQTTNRLRQLSNAAAMGDEAAARTLADMALSDPAAAEEWRRAQVQAQIAPSGGGGGSGTRVSRTETTRLQTPARDATPEEAAALRDAQMRQDQAERDAMVAMSREVEAEAGALTDTADAIMRAQAEVDQLERQRQAAERARQTELRRRQGELDRLAGEVASKTIDPTRVFAKGETRNRLSAAIGLALGGLADALRGGGDSGIRTALGMINQTIDRDVEAQRANLANAQAGLQAKRQLLGDMRATLGDEAAAEDATRALMLEGVERDIRALQLAATSDAQRANLDRLLAEIQQQKAAARQSAIMQGIGTTDIVVERRQRAGFGGGRRRVDLPDLPEDASAAERAAVATGMAEAQADIESADEALRLLDETSQVGRYMGTTDTLRSADARALDEALTRLALTPTRDAFGAANDAQVEMMQQTWGLTRDRDPEQLRAAIQRRRRLAEAKLEAARLGASRGAVREVQQRRPEERAGTQRDVGDAAAALGGTRVP